MNRQILEYTPLSGRGDTRILHLEPGDQNDELRGTLESISIGDLQNPYDAISYCWGDASDLTSMVCNGCDLTITKSSAEVLRRVRLQLKPRLVWIDRICINQDDIPERNQQVSIMKQIYKHASNTLVWLGEEADNSGKAFDFVRELAEVSKSRGGDPDDFRRRRQNVYNMSRLEDWEALDSLMNRPWWARVWMVQEVSVSTHPIAMCGRDTLDWRLFSPALSIPRTSSMEKRNFWAESNRTRAHYMKYTLIGSFPEPGDMDIPLGDLLVETRSKFATDPRDKVFAIFGLVTDTQEHSPRPDYSKLVERVYKEATKDVIFRNSNLSIIEYAGLSRLRMNLPSWCVDWTFGEGDDNNRPVPLRTLSWLVTNFNPPPSNVTNQYGHNFSASGSATMEAAFDEDLSILKVKGMRVDRIAKLGMPVSEENYMKAEDEVSTFHTQFKSPYVTGEEVGVAMKQTGHGGFWYENSGTQLDKEHLDSALFAAWEARRFCVTENGLMGLVPLDAEISDVIYIVAGCEVPLALREFGRHFALIGQSYVHGIMHGEVISDFEVEGRCWEDVLLR